MRNKIQLNFGSRGVVCGSVFPLLDCHRSCINQNWIAADGRDLPYRSIWTNRNRQPHHAADLVVLQFGWVFWRYLVDQLPYGGGILRPDGKQRYRGKKTQEQAQHGAAVADGAPQPRSFCLEHVNSNPAGRLSHSAFGD